jgi:GPI mannosyltransferase 3
MESLAILPQSKAIVLIVLPKILQGIFAATGDYFTWKLAERIYGPDRSFAWTSVCRRAQRLSSR